MAAELNTVAVVGAGYAGCAAAVELARSGRPVCLIESAGTPGGRARRVHTPHGDMDNGQHILAGAYRETLRLMAAVGAEPERRLLRLPLTLVVPGQMALSAPRLAAPLHLAGALLFARGLSWAERLAAARFMGALRRTAYRITPDTSVAELLARERQPERLNRLLWAPLCLAALNTPAATASAAVFARVLGDTLGGDGRAADLLLPRSDLTALFPEPACAWLAHHGQEVRLSTPVRHIAREGGGYALEGDGWCGRFSAVVLAVAPWRAARLLPRAACTETAHAALAGLHHAPILTCTLAYPLPLRLPAPMVGLPDGPAQWLFDRSLLADTEEAQVTAIISAPGDGLDRGSLPRSIHHQMERLLGPLPAPLWHQLIHERRATFSATPGLARPAMASGLPGLLLAGDYVASPYPATLEAAVRSGVACARLLAEKTRSTP